MGLVQDACRPQQNITRQKKSSILFSKVASTHVKVQDALHTQPGPSKSQQKRTVVLQVASTAVDVQRHLSHSLTTTHNPTKYMIQHTPMHRTTQDSSTQHNDTTQRDMTDNPSHLSPTTTHPSSAQNGNIVGSSHIPKHSSIIASRCMI